MTAPETSTETSKRQTLKVLSLSAAGLAALGVAYPLGGSLLAPALARRSSVWRDVGKVTDFPVGEVKLVTFDRPGPPSAGVPKDSAWLTQQQNGWLALHNHCLHLGCAVRYQAGSGLYLCPCHGSVYDGAGVNLAGPTRAPLQPLAVRVQEGRVQLLALGLPLPNFWGRFP